MNKKDNIILCFFSYLILISTKGKGLIKFNENYDVVKHWFYICAGISLIMVVGKITSGVTFSQEYIRLNNLFNVMGIIFVGYTLYLFIVDPLIKIDTRK